MDLLTEIHETKYPLSYCVNDVHSFVKIGFNLGPRVVTFLKDISPDKICVITDTTVASYYENPLKDTLARASIDQHWVRIEPGEKSKTLITVQTILEGIWPHMTRDSLIIALGGGVVGNIAGTVASLIFRGCPFIHIPTTLLGQADSSIGIKQAVNATHAKNAYGAYHTPLAVFNDIGFLSTLTVEQLRNGLAESVKVAIARSPDFAFSLKTLLPKFPYFSKEDIYFILEETIYPKLAGLAEDPYEKNSLLFLEIGHTIGHAIEGASYGTIHHGVAIAIGMLIEAKIGFELGITSEAVYKHLDQLLHSLAFPDKIASNIDINAIMYCLQRDNRRTVAGPIFVFPADLGKTYTCSEKVDHDLVLNTLTKFKE